MLRLVYTWQEGSVPPPHYYEYAIRLGPGPEGRITFRPGYSFDDTPVWNVSFALHADAWERLAARARRHLSAGSGDKKDEAHPPVGGSIHRLRIETDEQDVEHRSYGTPKGALADLIRAVKEQVPEAVWDDLRTRHERYRDDGSFE